MRALIIGYGSIGKRHADVLIELGIEVAIVSSRDISDKVVFQDIKTGIIEFAPEYIIIASATNKHLKDIEHVIASDFNGTMLIEKPLFASPPEIFNFSTENVFVGYNLRFHPVIQQLQKQLTDMNVISIQVYAGQYLPDWRPERDYRESYSAKKSEGGGVLRDLSHELDYLVWMLGNWKRLAAIGGQLSELEIDCDDIESMLIEFEKCPAATVQLNYLDSTLRREIVAVTNQGTVKADLVASTVEYNGTISRFETSRNQTYTDQHRAILSNSSENNCTFKNGLEIVAMIDAIERSVREGRWVSRE
jgi:predicted dehydrogenase